VVVGRIELLPLLDAVGKLGELEELFPATDDWAPYRELYPDQFAGSQWRIACNCYLLRSGGVTVLVDTGVGPAGLWGWGAEWEEGLFPALEQAGTSPSDVDIVFLTHLHIDHVGWNTDREGRLCFPNARYLAHRDGVDLVRPREFPHVLRAIRPVPFEKIDGETELAQGVTAFPLPGHLAGHMGLRVESDGERAVLMADTAVCPMMLDQPDALYVSDADPAASAATRRALLPELLEDGVLTVCGHYPDGGIGRVVRRDGRAVWEAES